MDEAIKGKDFATAHRVADALAQLLPGRNDIVEKQRDVTDAEARELENRPKPTPAPLISVHVLHLHSGKPQGPHCQGILSVSGGQMTYVPESASDGHLHPLTFPCSQIQEIKKNSRFLGHRDDFHVRTASGDQNFLPEHTPFDVSTLQSACSQ